MTIYLYIRRVFYIDSSRLETEESRRRLQCYLYNEEERSIRRSACSSAMAQFRRSGARSGAPSASYVHLPSSGAFRLVLVAGAPEGGAEHQAIRQLPLTYNIGNRRSDSIAVPRPSSVPLMVVNGSRQLPFTTMARLPAPLLFRILPFTTMDLGVPRRVPALFLSPTLPVTKPYPSSVWRNQTPVFLARRCRFLCARSRSCPYPYPYSLTRNVLLPTMCLDIETECRQLDSKIEKEQNDVCATNTIC